MGATLSLKLGISFVCFPCINVQLTHICIKAFSYQWASGDGAVRSIRSFVLVMALEKDTCIDCIYLRYSYTVEIFDEGVDEEKEVSVAWRTSISIMVGSNTVVVVHLRSKIVQYSDCILKRNCWNSFRSCAYIKNVFKIFAVFRESWRLFDGLGVQRFQFADTVKESITNSFTSVHFFTNFQFLYVGLGLGSFRLSDTGKVLGGFASQEFMELNITVNRLLVGVKPL